MASTARPFAGRVYTPGLLTAPATCTRTSVTELDWGVGCALSATCPLPCAVSEAVPEAAMDVWATGSLRGAAENCETPQMMTARTMNATSTRARGEMPQRVLRVVPGASSSSHSSQSSHSSKGSGSSTTPEPLGASGLSSTWDAPLRRTVSSRS